MKPIITAVEYYLPETILTNDALSALFPEWSAEKIYQKTGIAQRHISAEEETVSDMAISAAQKLFDSGVCQPSDVDYLLLCTQSPDYFLPSTACIVQDRLGLPTTAGALDFDLGCSGFVYGMALAQGLIESENASNVLLITTETYSKYLDPQDRGSRTIFGDGAAATLIQPRPEAAEPGMGPFVWGTDGRGAKNLIVENGGRKNPLGGACHLFMDGAEIFTFTLKAVPEAVDSLLVKAGKQLDDIDLFVFHQANEYMLSHLRKKIGIPTEKFYMNLRDHANTVSATIPIALKDSIQDGTLQPGQQVMVVGFGVGYSWGAGLLRWPG